MNWAAACLVMLTVCGYAYQRYQLSHIVGLEMPHRVVAVAPERLVKGTPQTLQVEVSDMHDTRRKVPVHVAISDRQGKELASVTESTGTDGKLLLPLAKLTEHLDPSDDSAVQLEITAGENPAEKHRMTLNLTEQPLEPSIESLGLLSVRKDDSEKNIVATEPASGFFSMRNTIAESQVRALPSQSQQAMPQIVATEPASGSFSMRNTFAESQVRALPSQSQQTMPQMGGISEAEQDDAFPSNAMQMQAPVPIPRNQRMASGLDLNFPQAGQSYMQSRGSGGRSVPMQSDAMPAGRDRSAEVPMASMAAPQKPNDAVFAESEQKSALIVSASARQTGQTAWQIELLVTDADGQAVDDAEVAVTVLPSPAIPSVTIDNLDTLAALQNEYQQKIESFRHSQRSRNVTIGIIVIFGGMALAVMSMILVVVRLASGLQMFVIAMVAGLSCIFVCMVMLRGQSTSEIASLDQLAKLAQSVSTEDSHESDDFSPDIVWQQSNLRADGTGYVRFEMTLPENIASSYYFIAEAVSQDGKAGAFHSCLNIISGQEE